MRRYRVPAHVAWVEVGSAPDGYVVVARVPDGPPVSLQGSSALIWACALQAGTATEVVRRVAEATDEPEPQIAADVTAFLDDLTARGLLTDGPAGPADSSHSHF